MFTILLFIVAGYLTLKELGRAKGKFDMSRQSKIDRENEANALASENISLQRELLAYKRAEFQNLKQAHTVQSAPQPQPEQGYRYVTKKATVKNNQHAHH